MRRITPYFVLFILLSLLSLPMSAQQCPCSIWGTSVTPATVDGNDPAAVELGVKFHSDVAGYVSGIRFYKSAGNTGVHLGNLWDSAGNLLASGTFVGESGTGWQQVYFSAPVAISANTTYVASYHTTTGHYSFGISFFGAAVDNPPLHALADGADGPNGVYSYGASAFPTSTYNASNYWVDVIFDTTNAPHVSSFAPTGTGVSAGSSSSATFTSAMDASTITTSTFQLLDSSSLIVNATVSYNASTQTAVLQPTAALSYSTTYTAVVSGGPAGVKDVNGNALASNVTWSFTTSAPPPPPPICPCSLWSLSAVPGLADGGDVNPGEYGVLFRSDVAGSVTGVRFYKSPSNTGVHTGHLWSATGQLLATATFANETSSGWQQLTFSNPVAIAAGATYVVSYFTPSGHYSYNPAYFNSGLDNGPLHAIPNATAPNGVYAYGSSSSFPSDSNGASNYWADVVFVAANGHPQPAVTATNPPAGSSGFGIGSPITATFNEAVDPTTLTTSSFVVTDASSNSVTGTITYNSAISTVSFQPTMELSAFSAYTATVKGTVKDGSGNVMGADYSWSFTTGAPPAGSGPGGPILVISSATNPFSRYYDEILRAEGMNEFSLQDIGGITPAVLSSYRVAILGEMKLTSSQVSLLTNWVSSGGSLIAMRPDKQLATMLGLTSTSGTLSDAYLKINTSSGPGVGIVGQTIQYHSTADLYTVSGASLIATLYSSSTSSTPYPAVTQVSYGAGQAAAFTYDLAHSVVLTRQGNPAWAGQDRINLAPDRPSDLFFGNASFDPKPDWNNLANVQIPIADEQQRLLVNMIQQMTVASGPLPRFWYLPSAFKAAIVMTGDDHNQGGTPGRFDTYIADSTPNCSVPDWQCVRGTSYMWYGTPITDAQAASYISKGFELAYHPDSNPTTCSNWTYSDLFDNYTDQYATFAATWPSIPPPQTSRMHCISWSDYDSQPLVELAHGIRLDTNYYYFPDNFTQDRTGMFNGTGMPMRFTDRNGNLIDVYQVTTQFPDEDTWTWPDDIDTVLDNAIGPLGYYGVFTANMHTDYAASDGSDAIVASAQARGIPIVTSLQMLQWLDGRNTSSFGSMTWSGGVLSFNISVGTGARNLRAMLPVNSSSGSLSSLTLGTQSVAYTTQTIKGVLYAFFVANGGSYKATYGGTPVTYTISGTISGSGGNGATVTLSGAASRSVTASTSGAYSFTGLANGAYTVTPSKTAFVFTPASQSVTVSGANVSGVNFSSAAQTYSISGTISGSGGNLATVTLSGAANATTTSNSTGSFTFTGRANGTYTVTPTKSGFAFTPASQSVTVNGANVTGVNFSSTAVSPIVQLSPTTLSFGSLAVGSSSVAQPVTLKNTGTAALTISSIAFSGTNPGDFAQTNNCGSSLAINATCTINVTFKPTATGTRSGSLRITDNASGSPQSVTVSGSGTGPMASLSVTSITFPLTVNFVTSAAQTVTLRNTGTSTLNITSITITGTNSADFAISSKTCGTTLTAGSTCTVSTTFRPQVAGTRNASLTFSDNAFGSPQAVALSGSGTMVTVSPTSLTFAQQTVGTTSAAQTVTLTNVGPSSLSVSSISFTGTNSTDFSQTNTCGTSLASGRNCAISVKFAPRARGTRSATLRITDSDPTSPQQVTLSGTGR